MRSKSKRIMNTIITLKKELNEYQKDKDIPLTKKEYIDMCNSFYTEKERQRKLKDLGI